MKSVFGTMGWIAVLLSTSVSASVLPSAAHAVGGIRIMHKHHAPGQPGAWGSWGAPDKSAYGTTLTRPVWFTVVNGALSEVAYPTVDLVQTRDSFLMVRRTGHPRHDSALQLIDERHQCRHATKRHKGTLAFHVESRCPDFVIQKEISASPTEDAIVVDYRIQFETKMERELIFVHNPTSAATAGGDGMQVVKDSHGQPTLMAWQRDARGDEPATLHVGATQMVSWSLTPARASVGFEGHSAPEHLLRTHGWPQFYDEAMFGNVAGALSHTTTEDQIQFRTVIAFTPNRSALFVGHVDHQMQRLFSATRAQMIATQRAEWTNYLAPLKYDKSDSLAESSILVLKALQDKYNPGALIAAPANPSIPWHIEAPEQNYEDSRVRRGDSNSGYRRVWPRDLYHKALAMMSVGDYGMAVNVLNWYRRVQKGEGWWSQNMWTDGSPSWGAFQIDQTALPIALTWRLAELGHINYADYRDMVRKAAGVLINRGPRTDQERWEENGGLSPNSFAATIEGLRAAAALEKMPGGDQGLSTRFKQVADDWAGNLKNWLLIPHGAFGKNYFARMEVGHHGHWDPSRHETVTIANKGPGMRYMFREDEILDGGFLQWILAGLVSPKDADFVHTIGLYDQHVRRAGPAGNGYLRYTEDAYGENHKGGAWPILSAERAIVALEQGDKAKLKEDLDYVIRSGNQAGVICEQDTMSVCPLGWSHAAYLILRRSIEDGRSYYIPRSSL
jgi:glucoamylase